MSQTYFALLTAIGETKLARAATLGTPLALTSMGVGDGNGTIPIPTRQQTILVNEVRRQPLNQLFIDPKNAHHIIAEQVIPENEGGWWIREIGLYDEAGDLCAVSNAPPTYKPILAEGSGRTQVIRMVLLIHGDGINHIDLKIDPSIVLASREYVMTVVSQHTEQENPHPQYATKESPSFFGIPKAPTPQSGDDSEQLANTAFLKSEFHRKAPMINLLSDSGRFYDASLYSNATQRHHIGLSADFFGSNFWLYSTTVANGGKFIHNNSTYGGQAGDLSPNVNDFLKASGRTQLRYGQEFYIAEFTADSVSHQPYIVNGRTVYMSLSCGVTATGALTFSSWIRCIRGSVTLDCATHQNGQAVSAQPFLVLPEGGWVHCSGPVNWQSGYSIVHFYCEPGSVFQIALPAFLLGDFAGVVHSTPLVSLAGYEAASTPIGMVSHFATTVAPQGWLKANGAAISRKNYAALFSAIGTAFGIGDGSTTFNLPDLRGEFLRGFDDSRGIDVGRFFGSYQAGTKIPGECGVANSANTHTIHNIDRVYGDPVYEESGWDPIIEAQPTNANVHTGTGWWRTVRPRNISLLACIKY